jgi:hypothetical protein
MAHIFKILINDELKTYRKFEDIPETFDNVIEFRPHIPDGPHTPEQHEEIDSWNEKLAELMQRESK